MTGRPSKYKPEYAEKARKLCEQGCTNREVAEFFQVDESTIRNWSHEHVEFFQALKLGKAASDDRVEQSLFRRAVGYEHDATKILLTKEGDVITENYVEHYPPDTTACIFWLKNRRPDLWRDKFDVETGLSRERTTELLRLVEQRLGELAPSPAGQVGHA